MSETYSITGFHLNGVVGRLYRIINLCLTTAAGFTHNNKPILILPVYMFKNYKTNNKYTYYTVKFAFDESKAVYIKKIGQFSVNDYLITLLWRKNDINEAVVYNVIGSF
jgi:hypothetical protein